MPWYPFFNLMNFEIKNIEVDLKSYFSHENANNLQKKHKASKMKEKSVAIAQAQSKLKEKNFAAFQLSLCLFYSPSGF